MSAPTVRDIDREALSDILATIDIDLAMAETPTQFLVVAQTLRDVAHGCERLAETLTGAPHG